MVLVGTTAHLEPSQEAILLLRNKEHIHSCLFPLCLLHLPWLWEFAEDQMKLGTTPLPDGRQACTAWVDLASVLKPRTPPSKKDEAILPLWFSDLLFLSECRACRPLSLTPIIWRITGIWRMYMLSVHSGHLGFFHDCSRMFYAASLLSPSVSYVQGAVLTQTAVEGWCGMPP